MAKIIIHRGAKQIGGVWVEISTDTAKVFIDLGENLPGTDTPTPEIDGLTCGCGKNSALFLTHYHGDHIGLLDRALPEVPVYMGAVAKKILINLAGRISRRKISLFQKIKTIVGSEEIIVGDIKITPLPFTDHSAIDAYMFVVEVVGFKILHTGDFRFHGMQGDTTFEMLNRFAGNIDYIICEGTLLSRHAYPPKSEAILMSEAGKLMSKYKYVFVICSSTNIERMLSFYMESQQLKRYFVCDEYQKKQIAAASEALSELGGKNFNMKYVYDYGTNLDKHMEKNGFCMLVRQSDYFKNIMEKFIKKNKATHLSVISEHRMGGASRIVKNYENCRIIYSMWTGYLDDDRAKNQELVEFLAPYNYDVSHTSGHASREDLQKLFDTINPKRGLIPIHTDAPEKFREIVPDDKLFLMGDNEVLHLRD